MRLFHDRREAGHELARVLGFLKDEEPIVLGLVKGGVPIAEVVAEVLEAQFDVLLIERLAAPKNANHIVGAVDEHGRISMIKSTARWHHLTNKEMVEPAREVFHDLQQLRGQVRGVLPVADVRGRVVIIVGQGVASGAKMLGAIASVRDRGARKVIVAAPAGSGKAAWQLHEAADLVVIPHRPSRFKSVDEFYADVIPVTESMVMSIIERWVRRRPVQRREVTTLVMKVTNDLGHLLCCELDLPPGTTRGSGPYPAVVFAHGFESDGRNPRSMPISQRLAKRGIIGVRPSFTGHGRSEGELAEASEEQMAKDLALVLAKVRDLHEVDTSRIGLVGSGAGSVLCQHLALQDPGIGAMVIRGPMVGQELDLAPEITTPTMLIYAERDAEFAAARRNSGLRLPSIHEMLEIPEASRLFADAISLELLVSASVDWLVDHLTAPPTTRNGLSSPSERQAGDGVMIDSDPPDGPRAT